MVGVASPVHPCHSFYFPILSSDYYPAPVPAPLPHTHTPLPLLQVTAGSAVFARRLAGGQQGGDDGGQDLAYALGGPAVAEEAEQVERVGGRRGRQLSGEG